MLLEENINLPERCMEKYRFGPLNDSFLQQLVRAMEFLLLFQGINNLPFQLIEKIGLIHISSDLKSDIALYKAACKVEALKAVEVAYKEHHNVVISSHGPTNSWSCSSDEGLRKANPAGFTKLRVLIKISTSLRGY